MNEAAEREPIADVANPMGIEGIEYVEYRVSRPQALGQVLSSWAFGPSLATVRAKCCCTGRAR